MLELEAYRSMMGTGGKGKWKWIARCTTEGCKGLHGSKVIRPQDAA